MPSPRPSAFGDAEPLPLPTLLELTRRSTRSGGAPMPASTARGVAVIAWHSYAAGIDEIAAQSLRTCSWRSVGPDALAALIAASPAHCAESERIGALLMDCLGDGALLASLGGPGLFLTSRVPELGKDRLLLDARLRGAALERACRAGWSERHAMSSAGSSAFRETALWMRTMRSEGVLEAVELGRSAPKPHKAAAGRSPSL